MLNLAPFVRTLNGAPVAVLGLGRSGRTAVRALVAAGARVWAWDDAAKARESVGAAYVRDLAGVGACGALVLSPGVPLDHPVAMAARAAGVEVLGDIEILGRLGLAQKIVAITGTNGKSTTAALTAHIARACGADVALGGNIGAPVLDLDAPRDAFVLEVSSFQADLCTRFAPDAAALTNLEPDHLARHGSFAAYIAAKERLFRGPGLAVIGVDGAESAAFARRVAANRRVVPVSVERAVEGVWVRADGVLMDGGQEIAGLEPIATLKGRHNWQNAAVAAALVIHALDLPREGVARALETWGGLPHRQFLVRRVGNVAYVNDSKGTNLPATATALAAFDTIYWIAGGAAREVDLEPLVPYLPRVRHAFLMGASAPALAAFLERHGAPYTACETLAPAVSAAHAAAQEGGGPATVLFSPAYQSFDQFRDFEDRGEQFAALVRSLPAGPLAQNPRA
ncbi:MAG: UDP-N-acetylmuramoyl-L-alanine--D-glutamate ligase [Alphaproteobacteria bacterium]|nr:UDP-N-acetylmuramoyl-L-alanine--D-glutamate ligase [Alphaproteobacteria bacterium]